MERTQSQVWHTANYVVLIKTFNIVLQGELARINHRLFRVLETAVPKLVLGWPNIKALLRQERFDV